MCLRDYDTGETLAQVILVNFVKYLKHLFIEHLRTISSNEFVKFQRIGPEIESFSAMRLY